MASTIACLKKTRLLVHFEPSRYWSKLWTTLGWAFEASTAYAAYAPLKLLASSMMDVGNPMFGWTLATSLKKIQQYIG